MSTACPASAPPSAISEPKQLSDDETGGTYTVIVVNNPEGDGDHLSDKDGFIDLLSIGTHGATEVTVRAVLARSRTKPYTGVFFGAFVDGHGRMDLVGEYTKLHSNGLANLPDGTYDAGVTAASFLTFGALSVEIEGEEVEGDALLEYEQSHSGLPTFEYDDVRAAKYTDTVDYFLRGNGKVHDSGGHRIFDTHNGRDAWGPWTYDKRDGWSLGEASAADLGATYYVHDDLTISGQVGTADAPATLSLLVDKSLDITAPVHGVADEQPGIVVTDDISGGWEIIYAGSMLIGGSLQMIGDLDIVGSLVVGDRNLQGAFFGGDATITTLADSQVALYTAKDGIEAMDWRMERTR